jgi:hypothetical protein
VPLPPHPPHPGEPCLRAHSRCLDPSLTSPLVHRCCRSPSQPPTTTGAPPPPQTSSSSHLLSTSLPLRCSGKPPLPPPCQAHDPGFPSACTASPAAPCLPVSPGRPRHRTTPAGSVALPRMDRRLWAKVRPSTVHPGFLFSFPFIFAEHQVNFKNA